jgi:hypothetical protein
LSFEDFLGGGGGGVLHPPFIGEPSDNIKGEPITTIYKIHNFLGWGKKKNNKKFNLGLLSFKNPLKRFVREK